MLFWASLSANFAVEKCDKGKKKILFVSGFPTDPAQKGPTLNFFYKMFLADIPQITKLFSDWKSDNFQES